MFSPSDRFECRWRASGRLLAACLAAHLLGLSAFLLLEIPAGWRALGVLACLLHAGWVLPRQVLLSHPDSITGLRRERQGWQLFSRRQGWAPVQLRPDSIALPGLVILRYRRPGQWFARAVCVPGDAMPADEHRRLRVRLKFSRRRWAAVGGFTGRR